MTTVIENEEMSTNPRTPNTTNKEIPFVKKMNGSTIDVSANEISETPRPKGTGHL